MAIPYHPEIGTVLICDFHGFVEPEIVKRRAVVVVSPKLKNRDRLCTVIPLSTTDPLVVMPYHYKLNFDKPLPPPYASDFKWAKCDMLATVSFERLNMPCRKLHSGRRKYIEVIVSDDDITNIRKCMLHAMALSCLTKHL